jgi:hypothetical protein
MADNNSGNNILSNTNALTQEALSGIKAAQDMAERFYNQAQKGNLAQAAAYEKAALMQKKIAEQGMEQVKALEEVAKLQKKINDINERASKLEKEDTKEAKEQLALLKKEQEAERALLGQRILAADEISRKVDEQKKSLDLLTKEKSLMGDIVTAMKSKLVQQIATIATVGNALKNLYKIQQNILDISVLSGNYATLDKSLGGMAMAAAVFDTNITSAKIGLRFLGYQTEEVESSFKEFMTTASMMGGTIEQAAERAGVMTETTGRLARMLGVTLADATAYTTEMQQKFNQTGTQTASAMYDIYEATDKYNKEAGRMVMNGRDVTKVMFDLARESKGVTLEQAYLSKTLSANILALQGQGRNYRESLEQASMYVKKMTSESPDWGKIFAGRELEKQMSAITGAGGEAMAKKLDAITPGLADRVRKIMQNVADPFTRQRMLSELLEGTSVGFEAMEKTVSQLINRMGAKANIAIQEIYGLNATQADALIQQTKLSEKLRMSKEAIMKLDGMSADEKQKEIAAMSKDLGLSEEKLTTISKMGVAQRQSALETAMRVKQASDATKNIQAQEDMKKKNLENQKKDINAAIAVARQDGDKDAVAGLIKQRDALNESPDAINKKMADKQGGIQGGTTGKAISTVFEAIKSPTVQLGLGAAAGAYQLGKLVLAARRLEQTFNGMSGGGVGDDMSGGAGSGTKGKGPKGKMPKGRMGRFAKFGGRLVKGAGVLAVAGAAYDAYDTYSEAQDEAQQAYDAGASEQEVQAIKTKGTGKAVGAGAGGLGGAAAGAMLGATIGSAVPILGTAIGGLIGAGIGAYFGSDAGKALGGVVAEKAFVSAMPMSSAPSAQPSTGAGSTSLNNAPAGVSAAGTGGAGSGGPNKAMAHLVVGSQGTDVILDLNLGKVTIPLAMAHGQNMKVAAKGAKAPS